MKVLHRVISEEMVQARVAFAGECSKEELRDLYAAADIVLLPSYSEGLPRVLLEAQSMQRPVVAYDVGGVPAALQDGYGGFLVKRRDLRALAARLRELLENSFKRREMGSSGRAFVASRFSLDGLANRHEAFYSRALERSSQPPQPVPVPAFRRGFSKSP
jgi:glycosyltransferase involved in cell wall biosynthesis